MDDRIQCYSTCLMCFVVLHKVTLNLLINNLQVTVNLIGFSTDMHCLLEGIDMSDKQVLRYQLYQLIGTSEESTYIIDLALSSTHVSSNKVSILAIQ